MKIKYSIKKREKITQDNCIPSDFVVGRKIIVRKGFNVSGVPIGEIWNIVSVKELLNYNSSPHFQVEYNGHSIWVYPDSEGWHPEELDFEFVD